MLNDFTTSLTNIFTTFYKNNFLFRNSRVEVTSFKIELYRSSDLNIQHTNKSISDVVYLISRTYWTSVKIITPNTSKLPSAVFNDAECSAAVFTKSVSYSIVRSSIKVFHLLHWSMTQGNQPLLPASAFESLMK